MAASIRGSFEALGKSLSPGAQTTTASVARCRASANDPSASSRTTISQATDSAGNGESRAVGPLMAGTNFRQLATLVASEVSARR